MSSMSIQWDHWRSFVAVADEGSLSAAGRKLGLTQPTVGRHIDLLEAAVGAALFLRTPHGLDVTELGCDLLPEARAMAASAHALERTASGPTESARGVVRLTASEVVGTQILPPLLAPLLARHRELELELALSNRNEDLSKREADLAIRMIRPTQDGLVARKLGMVTIGLYAHRDYLFAYGMPERLSDLDGHVLIGMDRDAAALAAFARIDDALTRRMLRFRCDNEAAQLTAMTSGAGIGAVQRGIARRHPALMPVLADQVAFALECWLVMHKDLRTSARIRLVFDHLAGALPAVLDD